MTDPRVCLASGGQWSGEVKRITADGPPYSFTSIRDTFDMPNAFGSQVLTLSTAQMNAKGAQKDCM